VKAFESTSTAIHTSITQQAAVAKVQPLQLGHPS
jgi:hypothetical protein